MINYCNICSYSVQKHILFYFIFLFFLIFLIFCFFVLGGWRDCLEGLDIGYLTYDKFREDILPLLHLPLHLIHILQFLPRLHFPAICPQNIANI